MIITGKSNAFNLFNRLGLTVFFFSAMLSVLAGQTDDPTIEDVQKAWAVQERTVNSFQLKVEASCWYGKTGLPLGTDATGKPLFFDAGKNPIAWETEYLLDDSNLILRTREGTMFYDEEQKFVDGKTVLAYFPGYVLSLFSYPTREKRNYPIVIKSSINEFNYFWGYMAYQDLPLKYSFRPTMILAKDDQTELLQDLTTISGIECFVLKRRSTDGQTDTFYLDPKHNFLPIRVESGFNGRVTFYFDIQYNRVGEQAPCFPESWVATVLCNYSNYEEFKEKIACRTIDHKFNDQVTERAQLDIPAGAMVTDNTSEKWNVFIQRPDGTQRQVLESESELPYSVLANTDTGLAHVYRGNAIVWRILYGVVALALVSWVIFAMGRRS